MLQESWMLGEIIVLAMFENEDALFVQKVAIQYEVWNLGELLQGVWRIGKDEIKLLLAGLSGSGIHRHESEDPCLRPVS